MRLDGWVLSSFYADMFYDSVLGDRQELIFDIFLQLYLAIYDNNDCGIRLIMNIESCVVAVSTGRLGLCTAIKGQAPQDRLISESR
jgi:hypothetical protein